MSYYVVMVIHDEGANVKDILEPYKETPYNPNSKWDWFYIDDSKITERMMSYKRKYSRVGHIKDCTFHNDESGDRFAPYAVITPDGEWHAPGTVGWWGMSSDTKDEMQEWIKNFRKNYITPYRDKWCTLVVCHI